MYNLISKDAQVSLPAKDYFNLLDDCDKSHKAKPSIRIQLKDETWINRKSDHSAEITLILTDQVKDFLAAQIINSINGETEDSTLMLRTFVENEYKYLSTNFKLDSYNWYKEGEYVDLYSYPEFTALYEEMSDFIRAEKATIASAEEAIAEEPKDE